MEHPLSRLPSVRSVLRDPDFRTAAAGLAERYRTRLVREVVARHRREADAGGELPAGVREAVVAACAREAAALLRPHPRRVVNATGVLVHTNLGRAPLGELLEAAEVARLGGYAAVEWDLAAGRRGERDAELERRLRILTGAEAALVVNNCAGALLLALASLAAGREVLVSRAELVEIGGSFRVPEVIEAGGCILREVGTTNRTRIADFERHAGRAAALLRVHQSNFVQRGFVERVPLEALVALGRRAGVPVVEDNGSGLLGDGDEPGLEEEPRVEASLRAGVDLLCCSGDKLLGGVQAGILLGRAPLLERMRRHPLYRALRLDKVRGALLARTLERHLAGEGGALPLWRLFHTPTEELRARAASLRGPAPGAEWTRFERLPLQATLGGGSSPESRRESFGVELAHRTLDPEALRRAFAAREVPVIGYLREGCLRLDLRTVLPGELPELQRALDEVGRPAGGAP